MAGEGYLETRRYCDLISASKSFIFYYVQKTRGEGKTHEAHGSERKTIGNPAENVPYVLYLRVKT